MTRKDGSLALLVVVVWGLNFVVIKLGIAQYAAADAGGPALYAGRLPGAAVCRPAGHPPLRLLLGYGLTISFGQFAFLFCAIGLGMPAGLASLVLQAQAFTIILGAFVFGERLQGKQLAGIALAIFGVLVLVEGSLGGEHVPLVGFMLTLAAALSCGLRQYFQQKNHVPGDLPANHIAGGVERIDPGAAVYVCLVADRWPAAHAGESTPDRYADGSLLLYLAFIATSSAMVSGARRWGAGNLAGGAAVAAGAGSGCFSALLLGETLMDAARRGGADHGRALYQRFRSASGAAWHGARVKKSPGDGAIHKYACNSITGRAAGSTARQVRQIYHCRPPYD